MTQETETSAGVDAEAEATTFEALGLSEPVIRALRELGYAKPFAVQLACVEPALAGRDLVVQAHTGSGKTAAFAIPIAERLIKTDLAKVQGLILAPTRELALQVAAECAKIGQHQGLKVVSIYGGAPIGRQIREIRDGAHLAVGTPGRVLDHLRRGTLRVDAIRTLVLDECDEMLSRGFLEDIEAILSKLPTKNRQTLLFSATIPGEIQQLMRRYLRNPEHHNLSQDQVAVLDVEHSYYLVSGIARQKVLRHVIEIEQPAFALVFCNTRDDTAFVAEYLSSNGLEAEAISSDLSQTDRERVMARMRAGKIQFLVATDVAARGIDLPEVTHVFNFAFPDSPDRYIHRSGRTGRAGKRGRAISLVGPQELGSFHLLKLTHGVMPKEARLPSDAETRAGREGKQVARIRDGLDGEPTTHMLSLARRVWQLADGERLIAGVLEHFLERKADAPVAAAVPRPSSIREPRPAPRREPRSEPKPAPRRERPSRGEGAEPKEPARPRARKSRSEDDRPKPSQPPISNDGREFWEVWADSKDRRSPPDQEPSSDVPSSHERSDEAVTDEKPPRPGRPATTRLYLNVGRQEDVRASDIARLLKDEAGLKRKDLGRVQVRGDHAVASVRTELVDEIIGKLIGKQLNGKLLEVQRSRSDASDDD